MCGWWSWWIEVRLGEEEGVGDRIDGGGRGSGVLVLLVLLGGVVARNLCDDDTSAYNATVAAVARAVLTREVGT